MSTYPKLEGRFPQVAGIHFTFDSSKEPNSRVDSKNVRIRETALDLNKQDYKVVVKAYMREGKDGFHVLSTCTVLVSNLIYFFIKFSNFLIFDEFLIF